MLAELHDVQHHAVPRPTPLFRGAVRPHVSGAPLAPFDRRKDAGKRIQFPGERVCRLLGKERIIVIRLGRRSHFGRDALRMPFLDGMIVHPFFAVALFTDHDGSRRGKMRHGRRFIVAQQQIDLLPGKRLAVHHQVGV